MPFLNTHSYVNFICCVILNTSSVYLFCAVSVSREFIWRIIAKPLMHCIC